MGIITDFLTYETNKVVEIKNVKLGLLYYFLLVCILGFVVGYAIVYNKGYSRQVPLIGDVTAKAKGTATLNAENNGKNTSYTWDAVDVVYPPTMPNSIFLTTNIQITDGQTRGICADPNLPCTNATAAEDCSISPGLNATRTSDGVPTGQCGQNGSCIVQGWCEVEPNIPGRQLENYLWGVEDFTIFARATVNFYSEPGKIRNSGNDLKPGMNYFTVGQIANNVSTFDEIKQLGAVVGMLITFDCNLDLFSDDCNLNVSFARLDDPSSNFSTGFNFRYSKNYYLPGPNNSFIEYRDLYKVYGIRVVFMVNGVGHKFDFVNLAMAFGSGIGLLSIATVIVDILITYILPKKVLYKQVKIETVEGFEYDPLNKLRKPDDLSKIEEGTAEPAPTNRPTENTPLV